MCDYSLYEFPNRLAHEGEELVAHRFPSGSMGLVSFADMEAMQKPRADGFWRNLKNAFALSRYHPILCAVCVPPGARLILKNIPAATQRELGVCSEEGVRFIETSVQVHRHRDAVQFRNGRLLPLQDLHEGQRLEVLSLAGVTEFVPATITEEQTVRAA